MAQELLRRDAGGFGQVVGNVEVGGKDGSNHLRQCCRAGIGLNGVPTSMFVFRRSARYSFLELRMCSQRCLSWNWTAWQAGAHRDTEKQKEKQQKKKRLTYNRAVIILVTTANLAKVNPKLDRAAMGNGTCKCAPIPSQSTCWTRNLREYHTPMAPFRTKGMAVMERPRMMQ